MTAVGVAATDMSEKMATDRLGLLKAELPVCTGIFILIPAAEIGEMPLEYLMEGVSSLRKD